MEREKQLARLGGRLLDILRRADRPLSDAEARAALGLAIHAAKDLGLLSAEGGSRLRNGQVDAATRERRPSAPH